MSLKRFMIVLAILVSLGFVAGCSEGPVEDAGEKVDDLMNKGPAEKAGEKADDALDKGAEKAEDIGEKAKNAVDR